MSQAEREQRIRSAIRGLEGITDRRLFAVEERRLRDLRRDLAKIDARSAAKSPPAGRDLATGEERSR